MTWANRIKLLAGLLMVCAIVAVFTVIFTQRQSEVGSTSASITAETYAVGTDYGGTVTQQRVKVGDRVQAGQALFVVRSLSLLQAMKRNPVSFDTASYSARADGTMVFKASVAGIVAKVNTKQGDFVQQGTDLATIDKRNTLTVVGDYTLTPRDYQRVQTGSQVDLTLPNQVVLEGQVRGVSVHTIAGQAQTRITVGSSSLMQGAQNGLITPGTPVQARLHLRQDGVLAGAQDAATGFLRRIGL